jgi:hypothetical protein
MSTNKIREIGRKGMKKKLEEAGSDKPIYLSFFLSFSKIKKRKALSSFSL